MRGRQPVAATGMLVALLGLAPLSAQAQDQQDLAEIGKKLANPVADIWALFTEFDVSWSDGDLNDGASDSGPT